jgi:hypothetical protein
MAQAQATGDTGVIPMSFSPEETEIFRRLIASNEPAAVVIPDDMEPAELWRYLSVTVKGLTRAQQALTRLKPLLGRILMLVKKHPQLYKSHGYEGFNDFMTNGVPALFGMSRPEAYNCVKVAEVLDFLPPEQMEQIGFTKLNVLATAIRRATDPGMPLEMIEKKREFWVREAREGTIVRLKEQMETQGLTEPGELDRVPLVLSVTPTTKKEWGEMVASDEIRAICQSDDPGVIFDRMMAETKGEWIAQAVDAMRG